MLDSQKIAHTRNEQSQINEEYISNIQRYFDIFDNEVITDFAQRIMRNKIFAKITKGCEDQNLIRLGLYIILFLSVWQLSNFQILWIVVATIYPLKKIQLIKNKEQQQILIFYYFLVATITVLEPVLCFLVEKMLPLYGIIRYILIFWLLKNDQEGCKLLYELLFIKAKDIDPDKIKEQLLDVVDKVSNRNF